LREAYLKSFLHLVSFNGESQFSTWLNRVAISTAPMLCGSGGRRLRCNLSGY
jgi:DNA-directed RNA polymerase specialized sigma24 family protein